MKFAPNNLPSEISTVTWQFGTTFIVNGNPDSALIIPAYEGKASFDKNTLSLELWNLEPKDSGLYSLTVIPAVGSQLRAETSLQVFGECVAITCI